MARPPRNAKAATHTVRLTINSDVYAQAKRLRAEIEQDIAAIDAYEEKHGSFAAMVRQHDGDNQDCQ